ncbi:Maf family nucleotide pyrophosphatase [Daejeonella sp.]|uniref:Maf family nucleotide pyrophosphatase n=1 Tax=Daejeonella sp. TaxID=2805397 RepID=UPI0025C5FB94|nr:Maf family nucleotide pyrophosphatase [Daejeonella sp.]
MLNKISPIILASKSPRRQELLQLMGIDFKVVLRDVDETYPEGLIPTEIAVHIAEKKAKAFDEVIHDEIVITADTIVCLDGKILGKPENEEHAFEILSDLSGKRHEVITAVCLLKNHQLTSFYEISEVFFKTLSDEQIRHYISTYSPMDKAGAYGIQEWIGLVAVEKIHGSYSNIVGLPTQRLYSELQKLVD